MTSIHEIQQGMFVETPHGEGMALFLIDYGPHINSIWVVANCKDGQIRHYDSSDIKLTTNWTLHINTKNNKT